jgi:hypothetical protein
MGQNYLHMTQSRHTASRHKFRTLLQYLTPDQDIVTFAVYTTTTTCPLETTVVNDDGNSMTTTVYTTSTILLTKDVLLHCSTCVGENYPQHIGAGPWFDDESGTLDGHTKAAPAVTETYGGHHEPSAGHVRSKNGYNYSSTSKTQVDKDKPSASHVGAGYDQSYPAGNVGTGTAHNYSPASQTKAADHESSISHDGIEEDYSYPPTTGSSPNYETTSAHSGANVSPELSHGPFSLPVEMMALATIIERCSRVKIQ